MAHFIAADDELKSERLEARLSKEKKMLLKKAAKLSHNSLSDFIIHTLVEKANKIIREYNTLELSEQDSKLFIDNLVSAPEAGEKLKQAVKKYKNNKS